MAAVKLDENVPDSVATVLREAGHDVALARDQQLVGAVDERVLSVAALRVGCSLRSTGTLPTFAVTHRRSPPASSCSGRMGRHSRAYGAQQRLVEFFCTVSRSLAACGFSTNRGSGSGRGQLANRAMEPSAPPGS